MLNKLIKIGQKATQEMTPEVRQRTYKEDTKETLREYSLGILSTYRDPEENMDDPCEIISLDRIRHTSEES